jgi:hypothetical protein
MDVRRRHTQGSSGAGGDKAVTRGTTKLHRGGASSLTTSFCPANTICVSSSLIFLRLSKVGSWDPQHVSTGSWFDFSQCCSGLSSLDLEFRSSWFLFLILLCVVHRSCRRVGAHYMCCKDWQEERGPYYSCATTCSLARSVCLRKSARFICSSQWYHLSVCQILMRVWHILPLPIIDGRSAIAGLWYGSTTMCSRSAITFWMFCCILMII